MSRTAPAVLAPAATVLALLGALVVPAAGGAAGIGVSPSIVAGPGVTSGAPAAPAPRGARIVSVVPNPVAPGDAGERVVLWVPPGTDGSGLSLADGEASLALPSDLPAGRVVVLTGEPPRPASPAGPDRPPPGPGEGGAAVVVPAGSLALANGGERLELRRGNRTLDAVPVSDAPPGERWLADPTPRWRPVGATDREPLTRRGVPVRSFALPDAPGPTVALLANASDRLYLAGYTVTSRRVGVALRRAAARGVDVRVLVEGGPVGGVGRRAAALLGALAASNVSVSVVDGPRQRYRFHHAKYAVVDDAVFVTSENWEASGVGGHGSRGWGTVARSPVLADRLADRFRGDAAWAAARPWAAYARTATVQEPSPPAAATFPSRFRPVVACATAVTLLAAPDNAETAMRRLLAGAERSILVQQVSIDPGTPLLDAVVAAARRGVRVRVLLSGAWYVREANRNLSRRLNALADREGLSLAVRLAEPRSRYSHVHVKGVVVDGERALVGSVNWNNVSLRENREVALVIQDRAVARYYARVFRADWRGGAWRVPLGALLGVGLAGCGAVVALARRVRPADGDAAAAGSLAHGAETGGPRRGRRGGQKRPPGAGRRDRPPP
ncbi:MAG: phospholipase D-like domain-containing protein [Halobacteriaceae archaeon]